MLASLNFHQAYDKKSEEGKPTASWLAAEVSAFVLTVYGQLVVKWQVSLAGVFPEDNGERVIFLAKLLINPWVISSMAAALLAGVAWMAALTQLQLSHAYPFMELTFVVVLVLSGIFFQEPVTWVKIAGVSLVVVGIALGSQG
jgi:drug/metabolite transporter (DMT)-like permease